ncbi:MAG: glycosyltransferase family 4 protein [Bacteroides sp.]|nr:glycosyltransferase family 4 protein [Prevotella sp.]MCM1407850.1 glycosyltransferase family 4 protein [Treponema brennaborense]MCM1469592.1 glycosyltransferase family 4 protein [Bacteroides sp.]
MKLAVDCRMIGSGGIGSYISSLIPYLADGAECLLFGSAALLSEYAGMPNIDIAECKTAPFSLRETLCFPHSLAKKINECDALFSPYCNVPSGITIPFFPTIHDVVFLDVPNLASKAGVAVRKQMYRRAVRRAAAVFTVSEFSAERIKFHFGSGKKVIVTYNAVPAWFSERGEPPSCADEAQTEKEDIILFVGNIKKHKGLQVLLEAFKKARSKGLTAKLLIAGNADNFRTSDSAAAEEIKTAPEDSVAFTGRISNEELRATYKKAKLLVQPSLYEGFGMPPLEAMSLGTKALVSDIPVFREIYHDFPVVFFKAGDADDLAAKLLEAAASPIERISVPQGVYSFSRTAEIILSAVKDFI